MSRPFTPWAIGLVLLVPRAVHAGPVEELVEVTIHPANPATMVLRYQFAGDGLVFTDDGGVTWRLLCGDAIDPQGFRGGPIRMGGDGTLLMGVTDGLWEGRGGGCEWSRPSVPEGVWISDLAIHPGLPETAFALTSNNTEGALNGLLRRDASGTWSDYGTKDAILPLRMRVVATDAGLRIYQDALRRSGTEYDPVIRVSEDEGVTWEEFPVGPFDGTLRVRDVDPSQPDRVVATLTRSGGGETVLVSDNRGATFAEYMTLSEFGGIAFAPDGRVWIGDQGESTNREATAGIWQAASLGAVPSRLNDLSVRCLAYGAADVLYACKAWEFGTVDIQSGGFRSLFQMTGATELVACDGVDMAATCKEQLCSGFCGPGHFAQAPMCCVYDDPYCGPRLLEPDQVQCGASPQTDGGSAEGGVQEAGVPDASDAFSTAATISGGGCACSSTPAPTRAPLLSLVSLGSLWLMRRRRS